MRAIIIATGRNADLHSLNERYPTPMLPLADKPFIQHIVETLVDRGVTEFDFVLNHLPEKIEHLLGNGARWGSQFRFHLARDASRPYGALKAISATGAAESILLAHADRLPQLPESLDVHKEQSAVFCCLHGTSASYEWTGWAWLSKEFIATLPGDPDQAAFESHLMSAALRESTLVEVPRALSIRSYKELLAAHSAVLTKEFTGLMLAGHEAEPGIWIARNVSLHPTAELIAPVYIGENCRIGMATQLGPNAVVGHNCVLDVRCTAANSVIFSGSYVGEALELEDVIIDKNLLVNARLGAVVSITDDFILGSLAGKQIRAGVSRLVSRTAAVVLLAVTWPILLLTALYLKLARPGPVLVKREYVKLPAPDSEAQWRTFQLWSFQAAPAQNSRLSGLFLRFLPALINVAKGELRFVGVAPRGKKEVSHLSRDWQTLYLRSKAGIVTEAEILYGDRPDEDELYSAEAFYSAAAGMRHDARLLLSYFGHLLKSHSIPPTNRQDLDATSEA
jgi:NDP-sugar pyrophosphorylase family protein